MKNFKVEKKFNFFLKILAALVWFLTKNCLEPFFNDDFFAQITFSCSL